ncbi:hypothetical protein O1611_g5365 [Lasiodiplodia mahajangana]|uniref:Uncharacterized protein n=1 Tax=Lasiodiplodia mahajangana TaxID=1108764 RepID=A0ACC2JM46_9PEZI|nr:hypothetical protein O1611_g5365 [Lasiodiplodia mahajangana]
MSETSESQQSISNLIQSCQPVDLNDSSPSAVVISNPTPLSQESDAPSQRGNSENVSHSRDVVALQDHGDISSHEEILQSLTLEDDQPSPPQLPIYLRKPHEKNPNFVGREDAIAALDEALLPSWQPPRVSGLRAFALCGFGGIGKTQIAIQYAFTREHQFDAILWAEADNPTQLAQSFHCIARGLNLIPSTSKVDLTISRQAVLDWLRNPEMKARLDKREAEGDSSREVAKWLLIFNNADKLEYLDGYWPVGSCGSVLITSRNPLAISHMTSGNGLELQQMNQDESANLLLQFVQQSPTAENIAVARTLTGKVYCVPLAIRQLASLIKRNTVTLEEFLTAHDDVPLISEMRKVEGFPQQDQYKWTMSTVWGLEDMTTKEISLLRKLALMGPNDIYEDFLGKDVTAASKDDYPRGEDYVETRTRLLSTSLIEWNIYYEFLSLHRLVQEVIVEKMDSETLANNYIYVAELLTKSWSFKPDKFDRERQANLDDLVPHIIHLSEQNLDLSKYLQETNQQRTLAVLFQECAWYLTQQGLHLSATKLFQKALDICHRNPSELRDELATTLFAFARCGAESNANPVEILARSEEVLEIRRDIYNKSPNDNDALCDFATAHTGVAQALLLLDRYEEAITMAEKCIQLESTVPEMVAGKALNHFALIYQSVGLLGLKKYEMAEEKVQRVIAFRKAMYGENDRNSTKLGLALQVLGQVYFKQGKYEESREVNTKAIQNYMGIIGDNYYRIAQVYLKLAECHLAEKQLATARSEPCFKPELARAYFKKSMFRDALEASVGRNRRNSKDGDPKAMAYALYKEVAPNPSQTKLDDLGEDDFDNLVRVFSR